MKFNPRSDGQAENMNKIVLVMLAKICKCPNANDWDEMLPYVQAAHNSTPHSVTGYKPFTLLFGRDFNKTSSSILDAVPSPYIDNHDSWIDKMKDNLARTWSAARTATAEQQEQARGYEQEKLRQFNLHEGDWVFELNPTLKNTSKRGKLIGSPL